METIESNISYENITRARLHEPNSVRRVDAEKERQVYDVRPLLATTAARCNTMICRIWFGHREMAGFSQYVVHGAHGTVLLYQKNFRSQNH